ncbi:MAG: hypothetical protein MMC33_001765 [Icmadophila ericetorum]|nr:hypothetical protein [Icmadophila ericetorum]
MESSSKGDFVQSEEEESSKASALEDIGVPDYSEGEISEYADSDRPITKTEQEIREKTRRKRTHSELGCEDLGSRAPKKRLRGIHTAEYRSLLNEAIEEAASGTISDSNNLLSSSQMGITLWSVKEKNAFFNTLDRKGRGDLQGIASAIGTKSVPEVHTYLQLLHQSLNERLLTNKYYEMPRLTDIPAAIELGQKCESALEEAATSLSNSLYEHEVSAERKKHGDAWLLDQDTVLRLGQGISIAESSSSKSEPNTKPESSIKTESGTKPDKLSQALELLNLQELLEMSKRFFMNSKHEQKNWRYFATDGERPAIFCTAFLDLYNLIVIITRRLVQSTVFCATSRLRTFESVKKHRSARVREKDVISALQALGMKTDGGDYYTGLARRCELHVKQNWTHGRPVGAVLSYSEIERQLKRRSKSAGESSLPFGDERDEIFSDGSDSNGPAALDSEPEEATDLEGEGDSTSEDETDLLPIQYLTDKNQHRKARRREKEEDRYVEAFDKQVSQREESRLWEGLGSKQDIKLEELELPPRPLGERKTKEDRVDWRDLINYRSQWDRFETPVMPDEFKRIRRSKKDKSVEFRSEPADGGDLKANRMKERKNGHQSEKDAEEANPEEQEEDDTGDRGEGSEEEDDPENLEQQREIRDLQEDIDGDDVGELSETTSFYDHPQFAVGTQNNPGAEMRGRTVNCISQSSPEPMEINESGNGSGTDSEDDEDEWEG